MTNTSELWLQLWIVGNPIKIEGAEFSNERAIYICNHASPLDIVLIMWLVPTGTVGIAKKEVSLIFRNKHGAFFFFFCLPKINFLKIRLYYVPLLRQLVPWHCWFKIVNRFLLRKVCIRLKNIQFLPLVSDWSRSTFLDHESSHSNVGWKWFCSVSYKHEF